MLPNVRLMIAAMAISVVALSCGFGVFAAFRVNHEPLARLPQATAPLRLITDNAASLPTNVTAGEPLDHRLQTGEPPSGGATATLAYSAIGPVEQPLQNAVIPAEDHAPGAPGASAPEPAPSQQAAVAEAAEAGQDAKPDTAAAAAEATGEPPETEIAPASTPGEVAQPTPPPARKVAVKKIARTRVAARAHHARRYPAGAFAEFPQPHFLSAPPEQQTQPSRLLRSGVVGPTGQ